MRYNNKDISRYVESMLLSFDYTDVVDGKHTDSISAVFEDTDGYWAGSWFPDRGATLEADITVLNCPGGQTLECGTFELDEIVCSGPPSTCAIRGLAAGITSAFRRQKKNRGWNGATLQRIAQDIATGNDFQLEFTSGKNDEIDRFDQREQSDLEVLALLCEKYGLGFYVSKKTIHIFDPVQRESQAPKVTFTRNADGYISHSLRVSSSDVYKGVRIEYLDPTAADYFKYYYDAESGKWSTDKPPSGYILKLNERCSCRAEAERIGMAALRNANKYEASGNITGLGNTGLKAGVMAGLSGFGKFDGGTYFIEQVRHHYDKSSGYRSTVELRGGLGY